MKGAYMRCFACLLLVVGILDGPLSFAGDCRNYLLFKLSRGGSQAYVLVFFDAGKQITPLISPTLPLLCSVSSGAAPTPSFVNELTTLAREQVKALGWHRLYA